MRIYGRGSFRNRRRERSLFFGRLLKKMEKSDNEVAENNPDWEKEADMDAALDFVDSF